LQLGSRLPWRSTLQYLYALTQKSYKSLFGLIWLNRELLSCAHSIFAPCLMTVGTIQIIYAASTSPGQHFFFF